MRDFSLRRGTTYEMSEVQLRRMQWIITRGTLGQTGMLAGCIPYKGWSFRLLPLVIQLIPPIGRFEGDRVSD